MDRLMKAKARHASTCAESEKPNQRLSTSTHSSLNSQFSYASYPESVYSTQSTASRISLKPVVVLGENCVVEKKPAAAKDTYHTDSVADIYDSYTDDKRLSIGSFSSSGSDMSEINNDFLLQAIKDSTTGSTTATKMDFHQGHNGHRQTAGESEKFQGLGYQTEIVYTHVSEPQLHSLHPSVTQDSTGSERIKTDISSKLRTLKGKFIK
ncbi:hypothetical protein CJU90_3868 [Yarrowia sp. C11]|nr:hypothetical protein CKK34_5479 [Yarrowia sp. E02]KAG5367569.1 hypothetical protein CJU90_3868 [Yarrowia sp. C11]